MTERDHNEAKQEDSTKKCAAQLCIGNCDPFSISPRGQFWPSCLETQDSPTQNTYDGVREPSRPNFQDGPTIQRESLVISWDSDMSAVRFLLDLLPPTSRGQRKTAKISSAQAVNHLLRFLKRGSGSASQEAWLRPMPARQARFALGYACVQRLKSVPR
ncbi:hypothetical protein FQN60_007619, partial [Etheostoma spectabile]